MDPFYFYVDPDPLREIVDPDLKSKKIVTFFLNFLRSEKTQNYDFLLYISLLFIYIKQKVISFLKNIHIFW